MLSPRVQQLFANFHTTKYDWDKKEILVTLTNDNASISITHDNSYKRLGDSYAQTMFILRYFGHIFTRIEIRLWDINLVEQAQFLINTYCSKAEQKIELFGANIAYIPDLHLWFEHVTNVTISRRPYRANQPFRLDTAFPQMRKLTFDCELDLNYHYPHLKTIIFKHYKYTSEWGEFLRLNPQLRTIKSPVFNNSMFLASISELPYLENLHLVFLPLKYYSRNSNLPRARFPHVKNFALNMNIFSSNNFGSFEFKEILRTIRFDRLESFSFTSGNRDPVDFLIGMAANNSALQRMTIEAEVTFEQLLVVVASLAELKELTLTWYERSSHGAWNRLLEHVVTSNHTLEKLTVHMSRHDSVTAPHLLQLVPEGWRSNGAEAARNPQLLYVERSA